MALGRRATVAGVSLAVAILTAAVGPRDAALAASATVEAAMQPEGYARIVFAFDRAPETTARLANSVLVVGFGEPVDLSATALARGLGALIGVIRTDPDKTAIRMSLNKPARLVTTVAGEKLFVDLLPTNWAGLPPPLPKDVIADLTRQAREGREAREEEARLKARPVATLALEGATHPTFRRLIFRLGNEAPVDWRRDGPRVEVSIAAPMLLDVAAARARLPVEFGGLEAKRGDNGLTVSVPAAGKGAVRAFREDGDFILDIDRDDAPATQAAEPAPHPPAAHAQAEPSPARPAAVAHVEPASAAAPTIIAAAEPHTEASAPAAPAGPGHVTADGARTRAPAAPSVERAGETLKLVFPFARPTPAAIFQRGRVLWAVFDDPREIDPDALVAASGGALASAEAITVDGGHALRFVLAEPRLVSAALEGAVWTVALGESLLGRAAPIDLSPSRDRAGRPAVTADLPGLGRVRRLRDPEVGDELAVATLGAPARRLERTRQFVEFAGLPTAQGLALALLADDVAAEAGVDQVTVRREGGLALSKAEVAEGPVAAAGGGALVFDPATYAQETARPFAERETELSLAAALAEPEERAAARLDLARFYAIRGHAAEAAGVLGAILTDGGMSERDERLVTMRAAMEVELGRPQAALAILASPTVRGKPEAALWRAEAEAASGRPIQARAALKEGEGALVSLPPALRSRFTRVAVELALEAGDGPTASARFDDLEVLPAAEGVAAREVLRARVAEALGQSDRAAAAYANIVKGSDPTAAAEAERRDIELGLERGSLAPQEAATRLERLVTGWRGDQIEAWGLARLIGLYGDAGRWREAFTTLRVAVEAFPDEDGTRALQDTMQERFTDLFLGAGADAMPKLDALALFYDFKELSPGGKRGDELVRRLADKLVDVDLLDQASDLLAYQIDNRLTGAARAQVAARAALVDLMNDKPARALETLRKTRQADLPASLLRARLRLEARALAATGRVDLALEIAAGLEGREATRLKAEILWSARRWPEAGEALETALGSSWRGPRPLEAEERGEAMRAAIAASLAGDGLAVDRIRQKFGPKMAESPEAAAFEVVTAPIERRGDAFREVARAVAASASFEAFREEYRRGAAPSAQAGETGGRSDKA